MTRGADGRVHLNAERRTFVGSLNPNLTALGRDTTRQLNLDSPNHPP